MLFVPSLPLLRLRVRNPCQPWVCSWCDAGDSGSRRARLLGPRGQGGAWDPARMPCPSAHFLWCQMVRWPLDLSPFPQSPKGFSSPFISSLIHCLFPRKQYHVLSLHAHGGTHSSWSDIRRHGLTHHYPAHHVLTLSFMRLPSPPSCEHTQRRALFHFFHSFMDPRYFHPQRKPDAQPALGCGGVMRA